MCKVVKRGGLQPKPSIIYLGAENKLKFSILYLALKILSSSSKNSLTEEFYQKGFCWSMQYWNQPWHP